MAESGDTAILHLCPPSGEGATECLKCGEVEFGHVKGETSHVFTRRPQNFEDPTLSPHWKRFGKLTRCTDLRAQDSLRDSLQELFDRGWV